jgi:hypothetical protein
LESAQARGEVSRHQDADCPGCHGLRCTFPSQEDRQACPDRQGVNVGGLSQMYLRSAGARTFRCILSRPNLAKRFTIGALVLPAIRAALRNKRQYSRIKLRMQQLFPTAKRG